MSNDVKEKGKKKKNRLGIGQGLSWVLQNLTLYQYNLLYQIFLTFLGSGIIIAIESGNERTNLAYVDALFMSASAISTTGLASVNFADFEVSSQIVIMILIHLGGTIWTTIFPPLVRRYQLKHKYINPRNLVNMASIAPPPPSPTRMSIAPEEAPPNMQVSGNHDREALTSSIPPDEFCAYLPTSNQAPPATVRKANKEESAYRRYIKYGRPTVRPDLGNEYRAIGKVLILLPSYIAVNYVFFFLIMGFYLQFNDGAQKVLKANNVGAWWFAIFHSVSSFNNAGLTLFADNLVPFAKDTYILMFTTFAVFLGFSAFPFTFRVLVWVLRKLSKDWVIYKYLLVRPRECYTHLFPAKMTRILFLSFIVLLVSQFIIFIALDWNNVTVDGFSSGQKLLVGYFQATSTRTSGLNVINLGLVQHGALIYYCLMMYVAIYPLVYSIRASDKSNKWKEETTESRYKSDIEAETVPRTATGERKIRSAFKKRLTLKSFKRLVQSYSKKIAIRDITWLYLGVFLICAIESNRIYEDPNFTVFKIVFECISGYGTVGLSLGYPTTPASFSAVMSSASKVIICFLMVLGRLRGLPDSLDYAVIPRSKQFLEQSLYARYQKNQKEQRASKEQPEE